MILNASVSLSLKTLTNIQGWRRRKGSRGVFTPEKGREGGRGLGCRGGLG